MNSIKIVAEIGCNHNGNIKIAKELVKKAKEAGANAVKFQTFNAENLVAVGAPKAEYQKKWTNKDESQLSMLKKLELTHEEYIEIKQFAEKLNIDIFSTAFDDKSIDFLYENHQNIWKIPSGEITNLPYLQKIALLKCENKEIILSTGMSTINEIKFATEILEKSENTKLTILHCNTDYPTKDSDMNLLALLDLKKNFPKWNIGLSDHSDGILAAIISVGIGISFIEKHFTLDKEMEGPDQKASITPNELKKLCENIRRAEVMLGESKKHVTNSERKNIYVARKSIIAKQNIKKGELFSENNLMCKRPGNGISPIHWFEIIGKKSEYNFKKDELIRYSKIKWEDANNE